MGGHQRIKKHVSNLVFIEPYDGDDINNNVDGFYQCPNFQIAWGSISGVQTDKFKSMLVYDGVMKNLMDRIRKS